MRLERAEPILPAHDLAQVRSFYERLGFRAWFGDLPGYEIFSRGNLVVHYEEDVRLAASSPATADDASRR